MDKDLKHKINDIDSFVTSQFDSLQANMDSFKSETNALVEKKEQIIMEKAD
jgi:hypothetical protein